MARHQMARQSICSSANPFYRVFGLKISWRNSPLHSGRVQSLDRLKAACDSSQPPVAAKRPYEESKHGRRWQDPYHWMRVDREAAVAYIYRENAYADECMADTAPLQRTLEKEMTSRLKQQQLSSPLEQIGSWLYYTRIPEGMEYPVYCRKRDTSNMRSWDRNIANFLGYEEDRERVLLDQNLLVEQFGYAQLGTCRLSEDHDFLAYTLDTSGNETFSLYIKDMNFGLERTEQITDDVVSVEWAREETRTIFYTVADKLLRPSRVFRRDLESSEGDVLVLENNDHKSFLDVSRTKDWSFITVNVNSKTSSEVYLINADDPAGEPQLVQGRKAGVQYFVEHHQGFLYLLTNAVVPTEDSNHNPECSSGNYRLLRCPYPELSLHRWHEVVLPAADGVFIEDMEIFEEFLVLYQRQHGLPLIQVIGLPLASSLVVDPSSIRTLLLPHSVCTVTPGANEDFYSSVLRISVSSPNLPDAVLEYDLASGNANVLQQDEVVGLNQTFLRPSNANENSDRQQEWLTYQGSEPVQESSSSTAESDVNVESRSDLFDLSVDFICQQHHVTGADGVSVPLTLVYSHKLKKDGQNPALLIGYGAYGKTLEVEWCSERLSLLERGWVVAFAHVRGGGEFGKSWHQSGHLQQKKNSFSDFVACANFLVDERYAHKSKLAALGVSAGGLLVAGAVNLSPNLFRAIVLHVPFLDMSNTLLDPDLPLSVHEYDEWGDPDDPEAFAYICSYSPYDNVQAGTTYPAMLVKSSFLDTRVGYWEAAKWIAKVRDSSNQTCSSNTILLKTSMDTGHFGDGGRFGHLRETAYDFAFLIRAMES